MTYANHWLVAVAMKQPYPSLETGAETEPTATESGIRTQLAGAAESLRNAQLLIWVGGAVVAVVVGAIGYAIGRSRS